MSFMSVLKAIGKGSMKVLTVANTVQQTQGAQLIEGTFLPTNAVKLINSGFASVAGAQAIASEAVHSTELTGAQKMVIALAAFSQAYSDYAKEAGLPNEPDKAQAVLQGVYDILAKLQVPVPAPAGSLQPSSGTLPATQ